jgi:hypothetical protein
MTASVICVGTGLLLYTVFENTGESRTGWTKASGLEINRLPLTNLGEPSALRRSTVTGTIGALIQVVPPSSGRLPTML